jgi:hypothetical protein
MTDFDSWHGQGCLFLPPLCDQSTLLCREYGELSPLVLWLVSELTADLYIVSRYIQNTSPLYVFLEGVLNPAQGELCFTFISIHQKESSK